MYITIGASEYSCSGLSYVTAGVESFVTSESWRVGDTSQCTLRGVCPNKLYTALGDSNGLEFSNARVAADILFQDFAPTSDVFLADFRTNCFVACAGRANCVAVHIAITAERFICTGLSVMGGASSTPQMSESWQVGM